VRVVVFVARLFGANAVFLKIDRQNWNEGHTEGNATHV
jgi:hypothetical protein